MSKHRVVVVVAVEEVSLYEFCGARDFEKRVHFGDVFAARLRAKGRIGARAPANK